MAVYLKEYRKRAGLTLQQVADQLGLKPPSVHKWESEATSPTLRDVIRLAKIYGIEPERFFADPSQSGWPARIVVWAKLAGIHPAAWFLVEEDPERTDEAKKVSRLLEVFYEIPDVLQDHWLGVGKTYPKNLDHADG